MAIENAYRHPSYPFPSFSNGIGNQRTHFSDETLKNWETLEEKMRNYVGEIQRIAGEIFKGSNNQTSNGLSPFKGVEPPVLTEDQERLLKEYNQMMVCAIKSYPNIEQSYSNFFKVYPLKFIFCQKILSYIERAAIIKAMVMDYAEKEGMIIVNSLFPELKKIPLKPSCQGWSWYWLILAPVTYILGLVSTGAFMACRRSRRTQPDTEVKEVQPDNRDTIVIQHHQDSFDPVELDPVEEVQRFIEEERRQQRAV